MSAPLFITLKKLPLVPLMSVPTDWQVALIPLQISLHDLEEKPLEILLTMGVEVWIVAALFWGLKLLMVLTATVVIKEATMRKKATVKPISPFWRVIYNPLRKIILFQKFVHGDGFFVGVGVGFLVGVGEAGAPMAPRPEE